MLPANARPRAISIVCASSTMRAKATVRDDAILYIPILFGLPPEGFPVSVRGRAAFPVPRGRGGARAGARPVRQCTQPSTHVGVCRPWWPAWKVLPRVAFRRKPYPTRPPRLPLSLRSLDAVARRHANRLESCTSLPRANGGSGTHVWRGRAGSAKLPLVCPRLLARSSDSTRHLGEHDINSCHSSIFFILYIFCYVLCIP